ncbi:predicted protein [Arabidopsis lyrata subsp. lyrata]|uniref:Predicted protein n=1 Tax=Arabidopsis lyrata subsp. lyrata TaxID=81972 RepID=D7LNW8_ARALL|nr:predicted protein [Arabidopsis lyrata subsp. lyrata]
MFDLWTDRDGPQLFESVDDLPSARFFPKGVVHSVKPYGRLSSTSVVDGDSDGEVSEVKDEEIGKKLRGRRGRNRFGVMGIERGEGGKRRIENRVNGGRLRNGKSSQCAYEKSSVLGKQISVQTEVAGICSRAAKGEEKRKEVVAEESDGEEYGGLYMSCHERVPYSVLFHKLQMTFVLIFS